jgi:excisionase family DNA binding protein
MKTGPQKALTKFYTIEQIAESMDVSPRTVRRWIANKLLVVHRIDGIVRVSDPDFAAFLAALRVA